jgi:hypothetical protein
MCSLIGRATQLAVPDLRAWGYQFVTLSELLGKNRQWRDFGGDSYVVQDGDTWDRIGRSLSRVWYVMCCPRWGADAEAIPTPRWTRYQFLLEERQDLHGPKQRLPCNF